MRDLEGICIAIGLAPRKAGLLHESYVHMRHNTQISKWLRSRGGAGGTAAAGGGAEPEARRTGWGGSPAYMNNT